jgi:hypothetical protein
LKSKQLEDPPFFYASIWTASKRIDCKAGGVNIAPQDYLSNPYGGFPTMVAHPTEGGYTSLLLGLHQDASAARRLQFDEVSNPAALD